MDTMLARDALFRDHARWHRTDDDREKLLIMDRMVDTLMDLEALGIAEAYTKIQNILRQSPSAASQLIGLSTT